MSTIKWDDPKDPADDTWWEVDCSGELGTDTLSVAEWTLPDGLTKTDEEITDTVARIKLSGGAVGTYHLTLDLTTADGQLIQRTITLKVKEL